MGTRYVEVSREAFCKALEAKGFTQDQKALGNEIVYVRQHHFDKTMFVKIYTSLPKNRDEARGCGDDAIRVVLIFDNPTTGKSGGLYKAPRVYRTGSEERVIARTLERARNAYQNANDRVKARLQAKS
jgi:hypothetical protein